LLYSQTGYVSDGDRVGLVAIWPSGVVQFNKVTIRQARLVLRWVTVHGSWYVVSHPGQLSLLPLTGL